ncbi:MAG: hypothetical protein J1E98_10480 [Lachnospiraceae bacterium]|nr:hypothetical protein [Lachnospiraceae bacterium]
MRKILLFIGINCDEFFVEVNDLIYSLENKLKSFENLYTDNIRIICTEIDNTTDILSQLKDPHKLIKNGYEVSIRDMPKILINDDGESNIFYYYLYITNKDQDDNFDVIPLRYFSIMRRRYKNIFLGIEEDKADNIQRISAYMFIDNLSEMNNWDSKWKLINNNKSYSLQINKRSLDQNIFYNQVFTLSPRAKRCVIHRMGSFNKIIPCVYLDWEWYQLFSSDIEIHMNNMDFTSNFFRDGIPIINDYVFKLQKGLCQNSNDNDMLYNNYHKQVGSSQWKRFFYKSMLQDICIDNLINGHVLRTENSEEILNLCKGMSMLALLLFSSFCHFIYDSAEKESGENKKRRLNEVEINNLKQSAQDFSEGLLQLIENALENSEGSCFSFRIHAGNSQHFGRNYQEFVINQKLYYLEVMITDINYSDNIPEKFIKTIKRRVGTGELPHELVEKIAEHITLEGFFNPSDEMQSIWDDYYKIAENVTNHYGLQLFNTLVNYYQGFFAVTSKKANDNFGKPYIANYGKENKTKDENKYPVEHKVEKCFPGTQYAILLPIKRQEEQKRVGIHIQPAFDDIALKREWKSNVQKIKIILSENTNTNARRNKTVKQESIIKTSDNLDKYYCKNEVYVIDLKPLTSGMNAELFSKAMISFILHHQSDNLRIALINVNHDFILQFTRCFAIFYNKSAKCTAMKKVQLFLCDTEYRTEINFSGQSLITTYASNELWANAKGEYNECLETLQIILNQRTIKTTTSKKFNRIAPFELLVKDNGLTLFERRVYNDLHNNIQEESFGCLLENIHMRVGSKMHVTDYFYETFQLFNSSLYNSRFAYLIASKINKAMKKNNKENVTNDLVLVGYDVYSELLILETKKVLSNIYGISSRGIIYEQMPHPDFRMWDDDMMNSIFVIIVPTSTTLTTHGKIIVELARKAGSEDINGFSKSILLNIALILIRDSSEKTEDGILPKEELPKDKILKNNLSVIEKNYWNAIQNDPNERIVWTKTTQPESIDYFVLVESHWQEPLSCQSCYPTNSILNEKPIIEVNRASVIPMIMAGPITSSLKEETSEKLPEADIKILEDVMYYGHGKRNNNHFQYYFKTDLLMQGILQNTAKKKEFETWLGSVKNSVDSQKELQEKEIREIFKQTPCIYDILVAPIHETNASFLEMINEKVFGNVPLILYIDSGREYRENILSKYSNLTALYNNILHIGRRAVINFHYIDDCINSGTAFRRTRDLLSSLFPEESYFEHAKVQVNLFQNIFTLLNRNSTSSVKGYTHKGSFFSYVNLKISGLRNHHENACALCSELDNYEKLIKYSALNNMALYWQDNIEDKKLRLVEEMIQSKHQDRYFRRMLCTHEINSELQQIGWKRNDSTEVFLRIISILLKFLQNPQLDGNMKMEYMMAYITVLSKPYLSYRKSILNAIFPVLLEITDNLINKGSTSPINETEKITKLINNEFFHNSLLKTQEDFLKVMINSLSKLGASYLIRLEVLNKIFVLAKEINSNLFEFELFYGAAVKRLITLGKDESNCLWLEYLLINGYEYNGHEQLKLYISQNFNDLLFYENTFIISAAIDELIYKKVNSTKDVDEYLSLYYFENFRKLMNIDYQGKLTDSLSEPDTDWTEIKKTLVEMVKLRNYLAGGSDDKDYYLQLILYIKKITNAQYACIYGIDKNDQVYIISSTKDAFYSAKDFRNINQKRKEAIQSENYLDNAVYYYKDNMILLCLTEKSNNTDDTKAQGTDDENMDTVWLMLRFEKVKNSKMPLANSRYRAAIRNVLIHRHLLWKRLQDDFRKNTFSTIKELSIQNKLLSTWKVGSHTPDEMLIRIEKDLNKVSLDNDETLAWAGSLLQLTADSLISKLYVEKVLNEPTERPLSFEKFDFSEEKKELLNQMIYQNKDKNEKQLTHANVIIAPSAEHFDFWYPAEMRYYNIFILASIVQNAVKHGKADDKNTVDVRFRVEGKNLIIENTLKEGYFDKKDENEEGITEVALKHYFNKYYNNDMVCKPDEKEGLYIVQIPVIQKER